MPLQQSFERFVALRYLRGAEGREEGQGFLRFITFVAIGGVALGVAALVLALSIVRGFSREIEAKIIGFGAHVQVESMQDAPINGAAAYEAELNVLPGVVHVAPVVNEFALLRHGGHEIEGVSLWGTRTLPPYLVDHLVAGESSLALAGGRPGLIMGKRLASLLNLSLGDKVTAFSMRRTGDESSGISITGLSRPRVKQFTVGGIYETSLADYDELFVFLDLEIARDLLEYEPDEVTRFDLTLYDVQQAPVVARHINEAIGFPVLGRTIFEIYRSLFAWVDLQQSIIPVVIFFIVLVAAFNIIGTLLMIILEKTREIGILVSMGTDTRALRRLFRWLGFWIGMAGMVIGEGLALVLALLQQRYSIIPLPEDAYYMKTAPIELYAPDFVIVGVVTLLLCVLAAYLPARFASRLDPIRAIRFR